MKRYANTADKKFESTKKLSTDGNSIHGAVEIVENSMRVPIELCSKPRRRKMALCLERYRTRIVEANKSETHLLA